MFQSLKNQVISKCFKNVLDFEVACHVAGHVIFTNVFQVYYDVRFLFGT